ncbi:hypothetical protein, partial [Aquifex sp.]
GYSLSPSEEKQLIKDIAEIKATLKTFMEQVDKRFEQIDKRFEQVDKRFEDMNRRIDELRQDMNARFEQVNRQFEQVNRQFEQLYTFLWIITGIFTTLTLSVIGFAWWDRRTIIRKAKEETVEYLERDGIVRKLLEVLKEKAKTDKELEAILRKFGLL